LWFVAGGYRPPARQAVNFRAFERIDMCAVDNAYVNKFGFEPLRPQCQWRRALHGALRFPGR
jgi:hypothetical protein